MAHEEPAVVCATNPHPCSVVQVKVSRQFEVCYQFVIGTAPDLKLPYAVAINGKVLPNNSKKPRVIDCHKDRIKVLASQGDKVSLYLNSDAHPDRRKQAVYTITVEESRIHVTITEKPGKFGDTIKPEPAVVSDKGGTKHFAAWITGDIWMQVTHRFSAEEAKAYVPAGTIEEIRTAVCALYGSELKSKVIEIALPAKDSVPACRLKL